MNYENKYNAIRESKNKYHAKIIQSSFKLNLEQSEKAKNKYKDIKSINAKAKELFLKDLEES